MIFLRPDERSRLSMAQNFRVWFAYREWGTERELHQHDARCGRHTAVLANGETDSLDEWRWTPGRHSPCAGATALLCSL